MVFKRTNITRWLKHGKKLDIALAIHPLENGTIILNYPGINGFIDGYNNKYSQIGDYLQEKEIGTFVRMGNPYFHGEPYPDTMIDNFRHVIDHCLTNSYQLSGVARPKLYLMGLSAGASSIAAVASNYPEVEKILLLAPSGDAGYETIVNGLAKYKNEVYIAIGEKDEVVGPLAGKIYYELSTSASKRNLAIVPDCDHQFRREKNGRILSKAPFRPMQVQRKNN